MFTFEFEKNIFSFLNATNIQIYVFFYLGPIWALGFGPYLGPIWALFGPYTDPM